MTKAQKKVQLVKYADFIKQRLSSPVPPKHAHRKDAYKQMLQIDLKKTVLKIDSL